MENNFLYNLSFVKRIKQEFRERRFRFFFRLLEKVKSSDRIKILDIGGTQLFWENMNFLNTSNFHVTLLNLTEVATKNDNFKSIKGTATDLSEFKDKQFDIVFSNSVIEHLFTFENQLKMANETKRVGKYFYVQTPNYYFPIEPHWFFPFFQFLPVRSRVFLTSNFHLGSFSKAPNRETATRWVNEVRLLTEHEMKRLFPGAKVYRENVLGLTKSITLYHFPD